MIVRIFVICKILYRKRLAKHVENLSPLNLPLWRSSAWRRTKSKDIAPERQFLALGLELEVAEKSDLEAKSKRSGAEFVFF